MAGIYIHIPFCKQACHYCNFHFSTSLRQKSLLLEALATEVALQRDYLRGAEVDTVYFGGGTPSLLTAEEIQKLMNVLAAHHTISPSAEITLEANPDDLSAGFLERLVATPVNRLSIGIQSFFDKDLVFMNRAHEAAQAHEAIRAAQAAGFFNLTIDLIYGVPTATLAQWKDNVQTAFSYNVPHLSCYCLTVEPNTALGHFVQTGKAPPVDEEKATEQFEWLIAAAEEAGYSHYEISNFARPPHYAQHNTNYWRGVAYLGLGPSAHSFDGIATRQWNIAHNPKYIQAIQTGKVPYEKETLTPIQQYNEYVMTSLRTKWGCSLQKIGQTWGEPTRVHIEAQISPFLQDGSARQAGQYIQLTQKGKLLADYITAALFIVG